MIKKIVGILLIILGCVLFGIGFWMKNLQNTVLNTQKIPIKGNIEEKYLQGKTIGSGVGGTAGAVGGAIAGAGVGASIGGVGVTLMGTGVGIPAGIVCLGVSAVCGYFGGKVGSNVGSFIGGEVGKKNATPDRYEIKTYKTYESAYSPAQYYSIMVIGAFIIVIGIFSFF